IRRRCATSSTVSRRPVALMTTSPRLAFSSFVDGRDGAPDGIEAPDLALREPAPEVEGEREAVAPVRARADALEQLEAERLRAPRLLGGELVRSDRVAPEVPDRHR